MRGEQPIVSARAALHGCRWAVAFWFGGHYEVHDVYRTRPTAERAAKRLNREELCSPGGSDYEVALIDFGDGGDPQS